jgi:hypothetical protein
MLTALGSVAARRAVRGAQTDAIEKLLDCALLDPDLAAPNCSSWYHSITDLDGSCTNLGVGVVCRECDEM